jgi:hypothetical protein
MTAPLAEVVLNLCYESCVTLSRGVCQYKTTWKKVNIHTLRWIRTRDANDWGPAKSLITKFSLGIWTVDVMFPWVGGRTSTLMHLVPRSRIRGAMPSLPQNVFMAWCLVKNRDNFTFTLHCIQRISNSNHGPCTGHPDIFSCVSTSSSSPAICWDTWSFDLKIRYDRFLPHPSQFAPSPGARYIMQLISFVK